MRKLNLALLILMLIALYGAIVSITTVYAEDQQSAGTQPEKSKLQKYDPCGDMNCGSVNPSECPKMEKRMMYPMMDKKMKGMGLMSEGPKSILAYAEKLNLTEQQRTAIDATQIAHKKDMIRKDADLEIARIELDALMNKDNPDIEAVSDQIKKIADMEAEIKIAQFKLGIDIKSILTKEQLDNLKMIKKHELYKEKMSNMPSNPETTEIKPEHIEQK